MPTQILVALLFLEIRLHLWNRVSLSVKCEWSYLPHGDILSHNLDSIFKRTWSTFKYDRNYICMIIIFSLQNKIKIIVTQISLQLARCEQIWCYFTSPLPLFHSNVYIRLATFYLPLKISITCAHLCHFISPYLAHMFY